MPEKSSAKRYASYCRAESGVEPEDSLEGQKTANAQYVARQGGELCKVYEDVGRSRVGIPWPELQELFYDAASGLFEIVVITHHDRLSSGPNYFALAERLKANGVQIETSQQPNDGSVDLYLQTCYAVVQVVERERSVQRKRRLVAAGYWVGGRVPFGYAAEATGAAPDRSGANPRKRLVPNEKAAFIAEAFDMIVRGESRVAVREYLDANTGRIWSMSSVQRMLENPVYSGVLRYNYEENLDAHIAIVQPEVFAAVRAKLEKERAQRRGGE